MSRFQTGAGRGAGTGATRKQTNKQTPQHNRQAPCEAKSTSNQSSVVRRESPSSSYPPNRIGVSRLTALAALLTLLALNGRTALTAFFPFLHLTCLVVLVRVVVVVTPPWLGFPGPLKLAAGGSRIKRRGHRITLTRVKRTRRRRLGKFKATTDTRVIDPPI